MSVENNHQSTMELLAPAGDWESMLAALAAGADAVYLGGQSFSARQFASNFDLERLEAAANLWHLHRRKIYVTVNTLIKDAELQSALDYLTALYNLGADAVIIQDLGLIALARRYLPKLPLFASTQMTAHNSEGAALLKQLGMRRVILARELTAAEVRSIAANSGLDVEVFIHGALCVCYSGQCLMSSIIGGRSGNRGRCAQPCRMEYQLLKNEASLETGGAHLLSPKDLCLISLIPELDRAGVKSLKIEGRMKRPEYVYTVVDTYRRALDRYTAAPQNYQVAPAELDNLARTFNRGFSTGYFGNNRNQAIMNFSRPNNRGVFLGRIHQFNFQTKDATVKLEIDLESGDKIEIWVSQGGRLAMTVAAMERNGEKITAARAGDTVRLKVEGKIASGSRIFKVFSIGVQHQTQMALAGDNPKLKIPCSAEIIGEKGAPLRLTLRDTDGNRGEAISKIPLQPARSRPLTLEVLSDQLNRMGNTSFYLTEIQSNLDTGLMLPLSELNRLRRETVEKLTRARLASYRRTSIKPIDKSGPVLVNQAAEPKSGRPLLSVWAGGYEEAVEAALAGADLIYIGGDELTDYRWDRASLHKTIAAIRETEARAVVGMPRLNREGQRERWLPYLEMIPELGADGIIVSDLGTFQIALEKTDLPLFLNYSLNIFNSRALESFPEDRIEQFTVSPELTLNEINLISRQSRRGIECLIQGPLELMVSEYCPAAMVENGSKQCRRQCREGKYALRDRLGVDFPIITDQFCRMHLLNSQDLCLYGDLAKLAAMGPIVLRLELKTQGPRDTAIITNLYRHALNRIVAGEELSDAEQVIGELKTLTGRGITRGHYFRGVD